MLTNMLTGTAEARQTSRFSASQPAKPHPQANLPIIPVRSRQGRLAAHDLAADLPDLLPQPARPTALQGESRQASPDRRPPGRWDSTRRAWLRQRRPGPPLQRRQPCRRGKLPATVPLIFSADETSTWDAKPVLRSATTTRWQQASSPGRWVGCRSTSAQQTPITSSAREERFHIAMARQ